MVFLLSGGRAARPMRVDRASPEYRKAFEAYLRYGTPIDLSAGLEAKAKRGTQDQTTTHYIWRTQGDDKVRPSHAANDGKIFAWDNPPPTGHPGEDYGCRCWAEPYVPDSRESFTITMQNVSDERRPWTSEDFIHHYFYGGGRTVTVRQTGHLKAVVAEYRRLVIDDPKRLPGQIADEARKKQGQVLRYDFGSSYQMERVVFSIGNTVIGGLFSGHCRRDHALLEIEGVIGFYLKDMFEDPLDLGTVGFRQTEIGSGIPYAIADVWGATVSAKVLVNGDDSFFKQ